MCLTYQTLPLFFNFNISSPLAHLSLPLSPSPSPSQTGTNMECIDAAAALKSSFRPEMTESQKPTPQQQQFLNDDVWGGGNESFVDELLDFSNEYVSGFLQEEQEEEEEEEEEEKDCYWASGSSLEETHLDSNSNSIDSNMDDFGAELGVPTDDLANLEWLSHFVDDSFSEFPNEALAFQSQGPTQTESKENSAASLGLTMETPVPAKARSKRSRTGGRIWSLGGPHFTESSSTSSTSSPSSSSSSSTSSPSSCLIFMKTGQNPDAELFYCLEKKPGKKPKREKKKTVAVSENSGLIQSPLQPQRRCSHCLVTKTPQWRTGPLGAKTLCNACGVRYKSGRLLPEYRPAGSPTFLSNIHSNSHRKVLEMRKKKDVVSPEPGLMAVQSF